MNPLAVVDPPPVSSILPIGAEAPSFTGLLGVDGRRHGFGDFADRAVLVLIFSSNRCPTAKAYESRMMALQSEYGPLGVQLISINSNDPHLYPDESYERMIERAADGGYTFPYLWDEGQAVARQYGPTKTFHVFVLDGSRRLRYEGRFDDSRIPERVVSHDLHNALDDVIAGREVSEPVTRAFGCSLDIVA